MNSQRRIRSRVSDVVARSSLHLSGAMRDRNLLLESTQIVGPLKSKEEIILSTRSLMSGYLTTPVSRSTLKKWHEARQMFGDVTCLIAILKA